MQNNIFLYFFYDDFVAILYDYAIDYTRIINAMFADEVAGFVFALKKRLVISVNQTS